jgi:carbon storage regulator
MLVLTRRPSEKIIFPGSGITVQVLEIRGHAVKIGVDAPREIQVLRAELAADNPVTPGKAACPPAQDRLQRARTLLRELVKQHEQGLGGAATEEILAEMHDVLEVPTPSGLARSTRLARGTDSVFPDVLAERAGFKRI